ncbi:MAG: hypothetical protein IKF60_06800 [Solobacterium sp.]|nr:hypothetical protein [Solobacterium sp.]
MMKNQWKTKLLEFMKGRYGTDDLNGTLLALAVLITIIGIVFNLGWLSYISLGLLIYINYRSLSKDTQKHAAENRAYLNKTVVPRRMIKAFVLSLKDKEHSYHLCPGCHTICRVPKGKGQIDVHCPGCGKTFSAKS